MIKMFINDEEVVSNKELSIKEEMLATPSTILNNCYPKSWENIKDYVSKFYYPRDYSRCIIAKGFERGEDRWLTYNESGSNINFDTNISLPFKNITIDGKSTQATSTNPVSPSPDYPSEIECVKGKNLFDGIFELGIISGSTGQNLANNSYIRNKNYIPVEELTDYKFSSIDYTGSINIYEYKADFSYNLTTNKQINLLNYFTTNKDTKYIRFRPASVTTNLDLKFQLEKGTTVATDYLPYNTIQVKDVRKNLLNIPDGTYTSNGLTAVISNGIININGTSTATSFLSIPINLELESNFSISLNNTAMGDSLSEVRLQISGSYYQSVPINIANNKKENISTYGTYTSLLIRVSSGVTITNGIIKPQVELGYTTEFEPYKENILNIDLQGNELCSLPNNVKDELVIENGRAKIIKNVGKYNITGNETWALSGTESQPYINFSNYVDNCKYPATSTELPNLLSNYYLQITRNNLYNGRITLSPGKALIIYDKVHNTSLANFKTWLKSAGVVVYYQLATPTEIDLGEVTPLSTFKGVNNVSLDANIQTNMSLTYLYKNYELIFCGIVKNSGNISLNPRYPHFCDLQILDFKNFLSESDMLDFVISNKTVVEAINMVIEAIKDYGFILGNVNIFGANDIIKAYSTQNKTAYDVFQYLADITGSRWYTRTIDEETVAIDFYDPTLMPSGMNIEYNVDWFEENQIVDLQFNYGSRDYRNKQVMMSNEVFGNINYNETLISNGYETSYLLLNNIGEIVSITINGEEKTFVTNELHDIGFEADFYYTPNKNQLESEDTYSIGTQIVVKYIPIIEGRQVVYNYDEIMRINNQTGRKGIIARYETRNDTTSSKELEKIGETYIKYKGTSEINLLLTSEKDLYNIGQIVYFDSPINELTQSYMVKTKEIKIIAVADFQKVLYHYELTSSFNSEKEINYFDNQRSKNKGNIEEGETITRNIDIENSTEILFNNLSISEVTPTGDNILDCILESPFID